MSRVLFCFVGPVDESAEVSIADAAATIAKAFGFTGKLVFDTSKADGQFKKTASNAKMRQFLPNFKFTDFNVAVRDTVQWFKHNRATVRM